MTSNLPFTGVDCECLGNGREEFKASYLYGPHRHNLTQLHHKGDVGLAWIDHVHVHVLMQDRHGVLHNTCDRIHVTCIKLLSRTCLPFTCVRIHATDIQPGDTLELSLHHDKNPKSRRQCFKSIHNIIAFLQNS